MPHDHNYYDTLIAMADDCPVDHSVVPEEKPGKKKRWFAERSDKWRDGARTARQGARRRHPFRDHHWNEDPRPSSGTRPPTRSSRHSLHIASGSPTQDTRNRPVRRLLSEGP